MDTPNLLDAAVALAGCAGGGQTAAAQTFFR